jgi:hypothetical protein
MRSCSVIKPRWMRRWAEHVARRIDIRMRTKCYSENIKGRNHKEDVSTDGNIILEWIHLAQERDQWWALVNTVMNLRVP